MIIQGLNMCRPAYLSVPSVFAHGYFDINKYTSSTIAYVHMYHVLVKPFPTDLGSDTLS